MDKKPLRSNRKPTTPKNKGMKNVGFVSLILLFLLIAYAFSNQPSNLKSIDSTQAFKNANAGQYSKVVKTGNQLTITEQGHKTPTLKTYVDGNSSLKEQGLNTN